MEDSNLLENSWDLLTEARNAQISSGSDLSYSKFITPHLLDIIPRRKSTLDVGCGLGYFTSKLSGISKTTLGIDPSQKSIEQARRNFPPIDFRVSRLEELPSGDTYEVIVLNMVLHTVPNLSEFLHHIRRIGRLGTRVAFSMCHPVNWPEYKEISSMADYSYLEEREFKIPFTISNDRNSVAMTPYFHRPWQSYKSAFRSAGLRLIDHKEPVPDSSLMALYPQPWIGPRFLFGSLLFR